MRLPFDQAVANRLERAAMAAADRLREQAGPRRRAVEDAVTDLSGGFADRFVQAAVTEADDRPKLAGVLRELADQVAVVAAQAELEQQQQDDLAAWSVRDGERRRAAAALPFDELPVTGTMLFDPRPSDSPVHPRPLEAHFVARERQRHTGGTTSGRSSADPERLRVFARQTRAADAALEAEFGRLRSSWVAFAAECSWAPVDSASFLIGSQRLLHENHADALWAERVADAFDRAGGAGSLSNAALTIAATGTLPHDLSAILDDGLSPAEVFARWAALGFANTKDGRRELRALPLAVLARLGNLEGAPYWARDAANRAVLKQRLRAAERRFSKSKAQRPGWDGEEYRLALRAVEALRSIRDALVVTGAPRFLTALTADDPVLAAVSIGDLDTAENVTWAVPGMNSNTREMTGWADAANNIRRAQSLADNKRQHAVIAWVGYHAPSTLADDFDLEVLSSRLARAGSEQLASSLRGLSAVRAGNLPSRNIVAHSYGSTTAAHALTLPDIHVDTFTTVGSAGMPDTVASAGNLHTDAMYSGQARHAIPVFERGDAWAAIGRDRSTDHHQDPTESHFGSTAFGTDGDGRHRAVKDHGVHTDSGTGYLDRGTESLWNIAQGTTGKPQDMTTHLPKPPTPLQEFVTDPFNLRP